MRGHTPECWKNQSLNILGVGGPLASCTCGLDADDGNGPTDAQTEATLAGGGYQRDRERAKGRQDERNPE